MPWSSCRALYGSRGPRRLPRSGSVNGPGGGRMPRIIVGRMDLRRLSSFLAVVEEGHFGRAATRLFLDPAAVTGHIQQLEREFGTPLLERSPVAPTPAGRRLVSHAPYAARRRQRRHGQCGGRGPGGGAAAAAPGRRHGARIRRGDPGRGQRLPPGAAQRPVVTRAVDLHRALQRTARGPGGCGVHPSRVPERGDHGRCADDRAADRGGVRGVLARGRRAGGGAVRARL